MSEDDRISLDGRAFVVAGAAGGLGRAICAALLERDAAVYALDAGTEVDGGGRDPSVVDELRADLGSFGGRLHVAHADVLEPDAASDALNAAHELFGSVDGLVMAAGARLRRGVTKLGVKDLRDALAIGLEAPLLWLGAAARHWTEGLGRRPAEDPRRGGSVILMASPNAFFGAQRQAAEAAAAAGVVAATRSAALELRRHHVRVNAIAPTARTRSTEDLPLFRNVREGSLSPAHVAPLVVHLLSAAGEAVHGEVLGVAGGRVYALHARETTGAFAEGEAFTPEEIARRWTEITRAARER